MKPTAIKKKKNIKVSVPPIRTVAPIILHPDPLVQLAAIALRVAKKRMAQESLRAA
jgi:hypothetical protein